MIACGQSVASPRVAVRTTEPDTPAEPTAAAPRADHEARGPVRRRTVPTLRVMAGADLLRFVTLSPNRQLRVGRDPGTDLTLTDPTVSKVHARVVVDASGQATVFDLKSTNGSAVNGRRVRRSPLRPGDHLEVGDVPLRLELLSQDELNHLARVCERFEDAQADPTTGLSPASFTTTELPRIAARCERTSVSFSCLSVSVDRFTEVRDLHGQAVAERVLRGVAQLTALAVRDADPCVGPGDHRVLVFLPGSKLDSAVEVAERIRRVIAGHDWARDAARLLVTVSVGAATRQNGEALDAWVKRAHRAARHAEEAGRNRVERAGGLAVYTGRNETAR